MTAAAKPKPSRRKVDELRLYDLGDRRMAFVDRLVQRYEVPDRCEAMRRLLDELQAQEEEVALPPEPASAPALEASAPPTLGPAGTVRAPLLPPLPSLGGGRWQGRGRSPLR